jgi:Tol biopolymer transport system component
MLRWGFEMAWKEGAGIWGLVAALLPVLGAALACGGQPALEVVGPASGGLVFVRTDGAQTDLFRARLADGEVRPLLTSGGDEESWPYWSEAGGRLVFQHRGVGTKISDLSLWTPAAGVRPFTATPARDEQWPEWSPDGDRVVFALRDGTAGAGLAWTDVATSTETVLATSGKRDFFFRPSFDPAGRRVVAQRRGADGSGSTLWIATADAPPRRVTADAGCQELKPFFERNGENLVFTRQCDGAARELMRADAAGNVTPLAGSRAGADEHSARPSPTRDEVAFVSDRGGARDVFLVDLTSGALTNLTNTPDRDEFAPRWSPDGERLVLTAVPPGPPGRKGDRLDPAATRLVVVDRAGHVHFETPGMMADWMPAF